MTKRILTAIIKSKYFIGSDLSDVEQAIMRELSVGEMTRAKYKSARKLF